MDKAVTLKKNHEFRRLYSKGKSKASPCLVVYCRKNKLGENRIGITVGVKVGCAVVRNRVRRRIREIYRLNRSSFVSGYDIVIVARVRASRESYAALEASLLGLFSGLGLMLPEEQA